MRQAVILVGGRGTRLGALAEATPKPLLPIAGDTRFLDLLIENVARYGVEEILLLAGHLGETVERRYKGVTVRGARIDVIREPAPAGTAGALLYAKDRLDDAFLLTNGDSLFDFNYLALAAALDMDCEAAISVRRMPDGRRYGRVETEGRRIVAFREKDEHFEGDALISGGVYVVRRAILDRITKTPCSIETDVFPALAAERRLGFHEANGYFLDIGLPETLDQGRSELLDAVRRPAAFFDRDGTLTVDEGYTFKVDDLVWLPGAIDAIRACNDAGWLAIVVTNQSGIARGLFNEADMRRFHTAMQAELRSHGAHIDAFYHSPFHEDGTVETLRISNHPDRKPNPGMLRRAMLEWPVDPGRSFLVGDTAHDAAAAAAAGLRGIVIAPGELHGAVKAALATAAPTPAIHTRPALSELRTRARLARAWLFEVAFPLWSTAGFDPVVGLFHERVALDGVPRAALPRRIRVQARQTFAFATAGRLGWTGSWRPAVEAGAAVLLERGLRTDGGTRHLLAPDGAVADERRDLYDTAFVAFALAHASSALGDRPDLAAAAARLLAWVDTHWSHPSGGFLEGEIEKAPPRRQNPHMHMFEACLALHDATREGAALARAGRIADLFVTRFVDPDAGALPEYFDDQWRPMPGDEGRIVEPGHHFEWSWLLHRFAAVGGADHRALAERLRVHAEVYGVDPATGVTFDEVFANGAARTRTSRLWPHTERLKANLARYEHTGDPHAAAAAAQAFDVLQTYLETPTPGLWRDRRLPEGGFVDEPAPASSFYHIVLAYSELMRVVGLT